MLNRITQLTRRNIFDFFQAKGFWWQAVGSTVCKENDNHP